MQDNELWINNAFFYFPLKLLHSDKYLSSIALSYTSVFIMSITSVSYQTKSEYAVKFV